MANEPQLLYWDACIALAYIQGEPDRLPTLDSLLAHVRRSNSRLVIVTSTISIVEVAFGAQERTRRILLKEEEERIEAFWEDRSVVRLAEFHQGIGRTARGLIRTAFAQGWSLKPNDATHLATAIHVNATEFQTYDERLDKFTSLVGRPIVRPHVDQLMLLPPTDSRELPLKSADED